MRYFLLINVLLLFLILAACSLDQKPKISLNGEESISVEVYHEITDPMATAYDQEDGKLKVISNFNEVVDFSTLGKYLVTYYAVDRFNQKVSITREVVVVDSTKPVIRLNGEEDQFIIQNEEIEDLSVFVSDNYDLNIPITSNFEYVNTSQVGTYYVKYEAIDSSGNKAEKIRTIYVVPETCEINKTGSYKVSLINTVGEKKVCGGFNQFQVARDYLKKFNTNGTIEYNHQIVYAKNALMRLVKDEHATTSLTYLYKNANDALMNRNAFSYFASEYKNKVIASDAIYLDSKENNGTFVYKILINGAIGWISSSDAEIVLPHEVNGVSYYQSDGLNLCRSISLSVREERFTNCFPIDKSLDFMEEDIRYYSFDGHFFYEDWQDISHDIKNKTNENAVNLTPYFNYYQYLPYHSVTNYSALELNDYIDFLIQSFPTSILSNTGQKFIQFQETFSLNAALELSMANHESAVGTSALAKDKNNLFGMNANDHNPYGNGTYFNSIEDGIYYHGTYYLTNGYISPFDSFRYNGGFIGNKYQGMNVKYASDIYWGEKIAGHYYRLDRYLGFKDYKTYQIGYTNKKVNVYREDLNTILYQAVGTSGHASHLYYPFIILDEVGDYYIVQTDAIVNASGLIDLNGTYDFNHAIGYVLKSDLDIYE